MDQFRCVAIETSTARGSVAVTNGEQVFSRALDDSAVSSRQIFGLTGELLASAQLSPADLDCVAFGCGPGSFTGVRVAAAAAQGLAFAANLPVCRVSSLAALARRAANEGAEGLLLASVDARMGEAYVGGYRISSAGLNCELKDTLVDPAEWRMPTQPADVLPIGPGWAVYASMLAGGKAGKYADLWPDAEAVLQLARVQFAAGMVVNPHAALPNYIRDNVTQ